MRARELIARPQVLAVHARELVHDDELHGAVAIREQLLDLEQVEIGERRLRSEH